MLQITCVCVCVCVCVDVDAIGSSGCSPVAYADNTSMCIHHNTMHTLAHAGGAYVPAMADETIIVKGTATIFLAGP